MYLYNIVCGIVIRNLKCEILMKNFAVDKKQDSRNSFFITRSTETQQERGKIQQPPHQQQQQQQPQQQHQLRQAQRQL